MEKALLVSVLLADDPDGWLAEEWIDELQSLTRSCGVKPEANEVLALKAPQSKAFIGEGQAERLSQIAKEKHCDLVIFNRDLTGTQQRNLESVLGCKTIDRTQLILDIFARRATSAEGKLQVELAQLSYLLPRLVGKGVELSRLGGGIGTRGPGETKLETNRRKIRDRITKLKAQLQALNGRRQLHRKKRFENKTPVIALAGYTNAGKSTLFNALTQAEVLMRNQLFSTLDPIVRKVILPNHQEVLFVDTVGFLHLLPHRLIEAFRATLEEVVNADLILHVLDISHEKANLLEKAVHDVLQSLGAMERPVLLIKNKTDVLPREALHQKEKHWPDGVMISAKTGDGMSDLMEAVMRILSGRRSTFNFQIPRNASAMISAIYELGEVKERWDEEGCVRLEAVLPTAKGEQIQAQIKKLT